MSHSGCILPRGGLREFTHRVFTRVRFWRTAPTVAAHSAPVGFTCGLRPAQIDSFGPMQPALTSDGTGAN